MNRFTFHPRSELLSNLLKSIRLRDRRMVIERAIEQYVNTPEGSEVIEVLQRKAMYMSRNAKNTPKRDETPEEDISNQPSPENRQKQ